HTADADPGLCEFINQLETASVLLNNFVTSTTVHVKDNRICLLKDSFIFRPAVQDNVDMQTGHVFQAFRQKLNTCIELMHSRRVRRLSGDENQIFRSICQCHRGQSTEHQHRHEHGRRHDTENLFDNCTHKRLLVTNQITE